MNLKHFLKNRRFQFGAILLIALVLPLFVNNDSIKHVLIMVLLYVILSLGLEVALGVTNLFSLCHAAFYGMGAYVSA